GGRGARRPLAAPPRGDSRREADAIPRRTQPHCLNPNPEESPSMSEKPTVAIIGAGPAGLTAAYLLTKQDVNVTVLEADPTYVGGISRTAKYKGFHFDIGGHRFFSKSKEVEDLWTELLPDDMLQRP